MYFIYCTTKIINYKVECTHTLEEMPRLIRYSRWLSQINIMLATYTTNHTEIPEYYTLISMITKYVPDSQQIHHNNT